eukprot:1565147-Amphidinium_carterae.1
MVLKIMLFIHEDRQMHALAALASLGLQSLRIRNSLEQHTRGNTDIATSMRAAMFQRDAFCPGTLYVWDI